MATPKQMIERGTQLANVLAELQPEDDDVVSTYVTGWNCRIHVSLATFRRLFGGQTVSYHDGAWTKRCNGIDWSAHETKPESTGSEERICPPLQELTTANV